VTELNPHRLSAVIFGVFHLIVLALRQQSFVRCGENPSNIVSLQVQAVFTERIFVQARKIAQRILFVFARDFPKHGR